MRKFSRKHVCVHASACPGVQSSQGLQRAALVTGVNFHPPQNCTRCLIKNLSWESVWWWWCRKKPSRSAYGAATTTTYHCYRHATKEHNTIFFSATIASNLGIMRLIPNSPKTGERTPMFLLALDQEFVRIGARKTSK